MLYEELINGSRMILSEPGGYTWTSKDGSKSSCLDIHLTNKLAHICKVTISHYFTLDHATLVVERIDKSMMDSPRVTKRKWGEVDLVWMSQCFNEFW